MIYKHLGDIFQQLKIKNSAKAQQKKKRKTNTIIHIAILSEN